MNILDFYNGFAIAMLCVFIQKIMFPGMILNWYYNFLMYIKANYTWLKHLSSLLGLCPYCYGFWILVFFNYYISNDDFIIKMFSSFPIWLLSLLLIIQFTDVIYVAPLDNYINKYKVYKITDTEIKFIGLRSLFYIIKKNAIPVKDFNKEAFENGIYYIRESWKK
jgi:hypothetical protein